jgi:hypothetical protein
VGKKELFKNLETLGKSIQFFDQWVHSPLSLKLKSANPTNFSKTVLKQVLEKNSKIFGVWAEQILKLKKFHTS